MAQYDDKKSISIANLVKSTWLSRYPRSIEIMYDQGSEFIGHELRKSLIEDKNGITTKPSTLGNPMSNALLEGIHQVLGNLVRNFNISQTYIDKNDPWTGILAAAAFVICSTINGIKGYSTSQLVFGHDMILLIKHEVDWEFILQKNKAQINQYNTREHKHRVDQDYKV